MERVQFFATIAGAYAFLEGCTLFFMECTPFYRERTNRLPLSDILLYHKGMFYTMIFCTLFHHYLLAPNGKYTFFAKNLGLWAQKPVGLVGHFRHIC